MALGEKTANQNLTKLGEQGWELVAIASRILYAGVPPLSGGGRPAGPRRPAGRPGPAGRWVSGGGCLEPEQRHLAVRRRPLVERPGCRTATGRASPSSCPPLQGGGRPVRVLEHEPGRPDA